VPRGGTLAEVKAAHRRLVLQLHPDKLQHLPDAERAAAQERFVQVQTAFEELRKRLPV